MFLRLRIIYTNPDGTKSQTEKTLFKSRVVVGRTGDIRIEDFASSRRHGMFVVTPENELKYFDLGSTNGTYVDENPVEVCSLKLGSEIRIGQYTSIKVLGFRSRFEVILPGGVLLRSTP